MHKNVTIHIGMHKCASTTLQRGFFANLPDVAFVGTTSKIPSAVSILRRIIKWEDEYYEKDKPSLVRDLQGLIEPGKPLLLSSEGISGTLTSLAYVSDRLKLARRLHELFPDAKILLVVRNQLKLLQSAYPQILAFGLMNPKTSFQEFVDHQIAATESSRMSFFHYPDYAMLIDIYKQLFDKVEVVLFEELVKDVEGTLRDVVCPLIGIDGPKSLQYYDRVRYNKRHTKLLTYRRDLYDLYLYRLSKSDRLRNMYSRAASFAEDKIVRLMGDRLAFQTAYTDRQKAYINDFYSKGNALASSLIGKDLFQYGYPGA